MGVRSTGSVGAPVTIVRTTLNGSGRGHRSASVRRERRTVLIVIGIPASPATLTIA